MAHSATDTCQCFGRAAAYAVYNLGVGIIVGIARTIVSTYYLAKQYFYQEAYVNASSNQRLSSNRFVRFFQELSQEVEGTVVESFQGAKIKHWKGELIRGLIEMIPIFGSAYFTYKDNQTVHRSLRKDTYKASTYGIKELSQLIENEYQADTAIRDTLGARVYNPIDLRFQEFIRG